MTEAFAHETASGAISASDRMVTRLLAVVALTTAVQAVRKTTLAALLMALEEQADTETYRSAVLPLSGSGLSDALLHLRHRGLVRLTDAGFQLTPPGETLADEDNPAVTDEEFLTGLVSKKFQEWRGAPATA